MYNNSSIKFHECQEIGSVIIFEVLVVFVFSLSMISMLGYAAAQAKVLRGTLARTQALHVAEAGVNYYQWRLAHFATDYSNGTGQTGCNPCGPYVRDYTDIDSQTVIGRYSLLITPPLTGSTVVTIQSTGWLLANPLQRRTVTTKYGIPSLAKYAFLTNANAWIGDTESVSGEFHTNGGVRFDGTGNAPIRSAKTTYTCTSVHGCSPSQTKPGIWGAAPQATQNLWQFPVPAVDFSGMTANLATIKSQAQTAGVYLPPSSVQGYSLVFNSSGTVSVYKVTSLRSTPVPAYDVNWVAHNESIDYNSRTLQFTMALPVNGLIFVEDRVWVEGTLKGRALVAAAKLPYAATTAPSIMIPNNLIYSTKNGTDVLGLLSQKDILIPYYAPVNLEIDAGLIAQNGSCQRYYYSGNVKNNLTVYGALASFGVWTWSWVNGSGQTVSGYTNTYTTYDGNLLYGPPPSFPLTTDGYQQMSWQAD